MKRLLAAALALAAAPLAGAQEGGDTPEMKAALAAGYKAHFTCAGVFNAGLRPLVIRRNELSGIYPDYKDAVAGLPDAVINDVEKTVSVSYSDFMPPRIAAWRPGLGCVQLPVGASPELIKYVPKFGDWPSPPELDRGDFIGQAGVLVPDIDAMARLEVPIDVAFDGATFGEKTRTSAVVVVRDGLVLGEKYARGIDQETPQRTWSVAKSLSATILGAAVQDGLIAPDEAAGLDDWSIYGDPRRDITVDQLLRMASGLDSGETGSRTDRVYFGGVAVKDSAIGRSIEAPPGARFKYANNDTLLALRALRERFESQADYLRYPHEALLFKIGAVRTTVETDWQGDFIGSSQVWSTARDLARIGQLYVQDGKWSGEQIIPADWMEYVSSPEGPQPREGQWGYGAQFWLVGGLDGLPDDSFLAAGNRGQYIMIIPSERLVIVRRGYDGPGVRFDITDFASAVRDALQPPGGLEDLTTPADAPTQP